MEILRQDSNSLRLKLDASEAFYYDMAFLQSKEFGMNAVPPFPGACWLARLFKGKYWLAHITGETADGEISLAGPRAVADFTVLEVQEGEHVSVDLGHLVGFSAETKTISSGHRPFRSYLKGLVSIACWFLGHPVPAIFSGPCRIVVYGQRLHRLTDRSIELPPRQVVAFPATTGFRPIALVPSSNLWSWISNSFVWRTRIAFEPGSWVLVESLNQPRSIGIRLLCHIVVHFVMGLLIIWMISQ